MAEAKLNFDEAALDTGSDLYNLYDRLYQGMVRANEVDAPAFPSSSELLVLDEEGNATFDNDGNPVIDSEKQALAQSQAASYSDILMKNSAYLFANSIMAVMTGGDSGGDSGSDGSGDGSSGSGSTTGFLWRGGDSMKGALQAWYGFDAGVDGKKIFEVAIGADDKSWANITGSLKVTEDAEIKGLLNLTSGIAFDGNKVLYYDNSKLMIENPAIGIKGSVDVDGTLVLGNVTIDEKGIRCGDYEYYYAGNSNKTDVDWTMYNAAVYGSLSVKNDVTIDGALQAHNGFSLGVLDKKQLYSQVDTSIGDDGEVAYEDYIILESDLHIVNGHGVKFEDSYILNVRNKDVVSFSAPGMTLNLGDSDNGVSTNRISLQSDIWDYSSSYKIISKEGAGYFHNGLMAACAVNGSTVLETYRISSSDLGVLFPKNIRFGSTDGPALYQSSDGLEASIPYVRVANEGTLQENITLTTYAGQTTSPFANQSLSWSSTLHFDSSAEFFAFDKPIEAEYFAIKSDKYHTRLIEDSLFFDDGKFIEGVTDGLRFAGNGYFDDNISSLSFAGGFAGYGWAVKSDTTNGGFHATFDSLTVRKKMRIYELEVQKISTTNGSLWVSDSCSGDEVIQID
jgi:hypothetical protein